MDCEKGLLGVSLCIAVLHVALEVRVTFRFNRFPVEDIGMDTLLRVVVLRVTEPKAVREVVTAPTVPVDGDTVKLLDPSSDCEAESEKEVFQVPSLLELQLVCVALPLSDEEQFVVM